MHYTFGWPHNALDKDASSEARERGIERDTGPFRPLYSDRARVLDITEDF